eukprot:5680710-Prymnesium_polylepis.3
MPRTPISSTDLSSMTYFCRVAAWPLQTSSMTWLHVALELPGGTAMFDGYPLQEGFTLARARLGKS